MGVVSNPVNKVKVYNLSSVDLTEGAISVAALGPKFVPFTVSDLEQTKIDILNLSRSIALKAKFHGSTYVDKSLITPVSNYIPKFTKLESLKGLIADLEIFANELSDLKREHVNDNLTKSQREGLDFLQSRDDLLYFKADKGSSIVFLDPQFYIDLVMEKLNSPDYEKQVDHSDHFTLLKLHSLIRKYSQMFTNKEKRAMTDFDYGPTSIYAVPKIHKSKILKDALPTCTSNCLSLRRPSDLSIRVIFGGTKGVCTGAADMVEALFKPFLVHVKSRVRDVVDFRNNISQFEEADLPYIEMWSVDVENMYPNIEAPIGLESAEFWIDRYPEKLPERISKNCALDLLSFVLKNNTGYFNGQYYRQARGTATGIKPAPTYADLVMGYLEIKLYYDLKNEQGNKVADFFWQHYRRYLDDGQIMWDTRLGDFKLVLARMNLLHPSIKFTSDCNTRKLVYLNVTILKTDNGFTTEIYNKPTDSDTYLPFGSSHPRSCKDSIPFELARSVRRLTDNEDTVHVKLGELQGKLERCGYPQGMVATACQNALTLNTNDLRVVKDKPPPSDEIAFVHTYDPGLPQLFPLIAGITSRLHTSRELRPIFGDTRIINSQREPSSLGRLLQHSKFEESSVTVNEPGVKKCGSKRCGCCADILEVNSFYFRNSGVTFQIKSPMTCLVRNCIYVTQCKGCDFTYLGETVNFRNRMSKHKTNSENISQESAEVSRHLNACGKGFWRAPIFKVKIENKMARLVIEDKLVKWLKPDLNRDTRNLLHLTTCPHPSLAAPR